MTIPISIAVLIATLMLSEALPAAQRTFVASTGDDADACSRAAPCRSFAAAMANTDANGEIVVLDSAGYGRVTIDRSVTIVAPSGVYAGIAVFAPDNGIDIATPGVDVTLRGLAINGQGGSHGVRMTAGDRLAVENCIIANLSGTGIYVTAANADVSVADTGIRDNGDYGIRVAGTSRLSLDNVHVARHPASGVYLDDGVRSTVAHSHFEYNDTGFRVFASLGSTQTALALADTTIVGHSFAGIWVNATGASSGSRVYMRGNTITGNSIFGVDVQAAAAASALASIVGNTVGDNGYGVQATGPGPAKIVAANNTVNRNGNVGFNNSGGMFFSNYENTLTANNSGGAQTAGTIPFLGGL